MEKAERKEAQRTECPNPQRERKGYICLNGEWDFEMEGRGAEKSFGRINVPFCPESALSGVGYTDFIAGCVYKRRVEIAPEALGNRVFLCFGAADYKARVYVNAKFAGKHEGGYTPFEFDITESLTAGVNEIAVSVSDAAGAGVPSGKQSPRRGSFGCFYTRVTGIWQTVYLETRPREYIRSFRFFPDPERAAVGAEVLTTGAGRVRIDVFYEGKPVGSAEGEITVKGAFNVPLTEKHLWEAGNGRLYDVVLRYGADEVTSYFGLRSVKFEGKKFLLNGKSVFQRFVLDQGYYPDGAYTAPDDGRMAEDIEAAVNLGFNGLRLHQKLFDPRYLWHCDKRGVMVWGEYASWGVDHTDMKIFGRFADEWREAVERDFNHPCIVLWSPFNEAWEDLSDGRKARDARLIEAVYDLTKTLDPTRPCIDTSGGYHGRRTDACDVHCYGDCGEMSDLLGALGKGVLTGAKAYLPGEGAAYAGGPVAVSEYGGRALRTGNGAKRTDCMDNTEAWGYENVLESEEAFADWYVRLTGLLLDDENLFGFCYTQLYDIEQEQNGLYTYGRKLKFGPETAEAIRKCNGRAAAVEK
ncbi:MAG: beta-galactosidase [Clostridiales bacterium]|jgi:hypothetical protein|nr:beta-galactosidase [Clostridiales bacterium]